MRGPCPMPSARRRNIPVVTTLAGGYARRLEDTIQIHVNSILAAQQISNSSYREGTTSVVP